MINVGYYPQPLDRTQFIEVQLVNGYTTARLRSTLQFSGTTTGTVSKIPALNENRVRGLFCNTGLTAGSLQLVQVADPVSGPRENLGTPVVMQAGGRVAYDFTPQYGFLEMKCSGGGPTTVRVQLTSRIQFQQMAFAKTETTLFPTALWAPNNITTPIN